MRIVVAVKRVGLLAESFSFTEDGWSIEPRDLTWTMNPYDRQALRIAAALVSEAGEGEVVALAAGDVDADELLQECHAEGAGRLVRLWDESLVVSDPLCMARALAPVVELLQPDLVLFGLQGGDTPHAATGVAVAQHLDLPCAVAAETIASVPDGILVQVDQGDARLSLKVSLPAVVTVCGTAETAMRAMPAMPASVPVEVVGFDQLGLSEELVDSFAGAWLRSVARQPRRL